MRNLYVFIIFLMFIIRKDNVILGAVSALSFWSKNLFPILFPTFILVDLILSTTLPKYVSKVFGRFFKVLFKSPPISAFVFFLSLLCGTTTNAKLLKSMCDEGSIKSQDINKILSFCFFFNPFLIISFAGIKVLLIIWISNILVGIISRNNYKTENNDGILTQIHFSLSRSVGINLDIILNILGSVTVFMCVSYVIPFISPTINVISSSFLELSTAMYKNKLYFNSDYLYIFMFSIGVISIFSQIKSIMKDTSIDYKYLIKTRLLSLIIGLFICFIT